MQVSSHISFIKKTVGKTKGSRPPAPAKGFLNDLSDLSGESLADELQEEIQEAQEEIQGDNLKVKEGTKEEEETDEQEDTWGAKMRRMGKEWNRKK